MATGNFYVKNANDVYAFAMEAEDCFDFDDSLDCIKEAGISKYGFEETSGSDGDYILDKSFGGKNFYNSGLTVNIDITIIVRGGYYQGANLDFELEVMNDNYYPYKLGDYESEDDLIDDMADEFVDYCDEVYNYGLRKCFKKRYKAFLEDYIDKAIEYANNVLKNLCEEEYSIVGVFSNGETLYRKVNK